MLHVYAWVIIFASFFVYVYTVVDIVVVVAVAAAAVVVIVIIAVSVTDAVIVFAGITADTSFTDMNLHTHMHTLECIEKWTT